MGFCIDGLALWLQVRGLGLEGLPEMEYVVEGLKIRGR